MIKSIETVYNGYRFRSRSEARWAVFFDAAEIRYEYEPEGFDLGDSGWYLPDFRITSGLFGVDYVEIKPISYQPEAARKAEQLAVGNKCNVLMLFGTPGYVQTRVSQFDWCNKFDYTATIYMANFARAPIAFGPMIRVIGGDNRILSSPCLITDKNSFDRKDLAAYILSSNFHEPTELAFINWPQPSMDHDMCKRMKDAYRKAKMARFEFGEVGGWL